jgi:prepilin-type N-terminal cleavage/methylation domain-containing protein
MIDTVQTRGRFAETMAAIRRAAAHEGGFTLIEVMIAIVLMTIGLLAVAQVYPGLMAMSLYGKDQSRGANLAQQQMEDFRSDTTTQLTNDVGDYDTVAGLTQYFDQNGVSTTQAAAYFTRSVQIQYWTWSVAANAFTAPASPYTAPAGSYVYHIAVTTHWPVRGQTIFTSGNINSPNGCVQSGAVVSTGLGCITITSFVAP